MSSEDLVTRALTGDEDDQSVRVVLCQLVIDYYQVLGVPVSEALLSILLKQTLGADRITSEGLQSALDWAESVLAGADFPLLICSAAADGTRSWRPHPSSIDSGTRDRRPIHRVIVGVLSEMASLIAEGDSTSTAMQYLANAARANPSTAPAAAKVGQRFIESGDLSTGKQFMLITIQFGDRDTAALVAGGLVEILASAGDVEGKREVLELLVELRSPEYHSRALFLLGECLTDLGRPEAAESRFRAVIETQHDRYVRLGAAHLAILLSQSGRSAEAAEKVGLALAGESSSASSEAASQLLRLADAVTDPARSVDAYAAIIDGCAIDNPHLSRFVANLSSILSLHIEQFPRILQEHSGWTAGWSVVALANSLEFVDLEAAVQVCEVAILSGRSEPARDAARVLGRLLRTHEDVPNAAEAISCIVRNPT